MAELNRNLNGGGGCPLLGTGTTSEEAPQQQERYKEAEKAPTVSDIKNFFGG